MFVVIRLILVSVFLVTSIFLIKKLKLISKYKLYINFICISVALFVVLSFLPFENYFITFSSPKTAYEYFSFGRSNIELVVEGDNCDFIVDNKGGSNKYMIIPKTRDGWKIGVGFNTRRIAQKFSNDVIVYVYQYKDTNDYFITLLNTAGGAIRVSDEYNTKFYQLKEYNDVLGKTIVTYYAHISNYNSQYSVEVNGNRIVLKS